MAWVAGELSSARALLDAALELRAQGFADVDTHTPYPVHGASEALGLRRSPIAAWCLAGALAGASGGYVMQWYLNAVDYPINVGGRPLHSAPAFVPVTFELAVLLGSLTVFVGLMALLRFPRVHHPLFEVPGFESASVDGFWLSVRAPAGTASLRIADALRALGAVRVAAIEEPP